VADILADDPALTSKILKAANSAYYGFPREIGTLERAVALLGFNMVRSLALSIGIMHRLPSGIRSSHFSEEGLWTHSLAVAKAMEGLGRNARPGESREHLFVVGLLHDIGKVVLIEFFRDTFVQALEEAQRPETALLHVAEKRLFGFDHGEVGAMLLTRWKIPPVIAGPIGAHHEVGFPDGIDEVDVALLRLSDAVCQNLDLGEGGSLTPVDVPDQDLRVLQVGDTALEGVKEHLEESRGAIEGFFYSLQ
jgi:putative nucleotidyltransferase with HDIG domain